MDRSTTAPRLRWRRGSAVDGRKIAWKCISDKHLASPMTVRCMPAWASVLAEPAGRVRHAHRRSGTASQALA